MSLAVNLGVCVLHALVHRAMNLRGTVRGQCLFSQEMYNTCTADVKDLHLCLHPAKPGTKKRVPVPPFLCSPGSFVANMLGIFLFA